MVEQIRSSSFQVIKSDILEKIKNRHWLPGDTIPGEEALAAGYGCSRMTVNRALRELAESGVVERRRKTGTRVTREPDRAATLTIPVIRKEIEGRGAVYRYALIERREVTPPDGVRAKLSLPPRGRALHVRCLHFADEAPYQYEDRWINLERIPAARDESFRQAGPNEWLIGEEPLAEAEHVFSAQPADPDTAGLLGVRPGDPLFVVERRTWRDEDTITAVTLSHPGATYRMVSRR